MSKRLLVLFMLVLTMIPFVNVQAQTTNEWIDFCSILQTSDCQILVDSAATMSDVSSFSFDMLLEFDVEADGGSMAGMGDMNFSLAGNGMVEIDVALFTELQAIADDLEQFPKMMEDALSGFEGEAYFVLTLPDMFGALVGSTEIPLNLLMEEGIYAFDLASLEQALGEDPSGMEWVGIDMDGLADILMDEMDSPSVDSADMNPLSSMDAVTSALSISRLADSEINGESVAVFEFVLDYGAYLSSSGMKETLEEMYSDLGMSADEIELTLEMAEGIELAFQQYIGLDDLYSYRIDMDIVFSGTGEAMGDPSVDSMTMTMNFLIDMSNFNAPVDIELPADAMILPIDMLMTMGSGF